MKDNKHTKSCLFQKINELFLTRIKNFFYESSFETANEFLDLTDYPPPPHHFNGST